MMSATPIFEQLCRDFLEAANSPSANSTQPLIVSQRKGPAHSIDDAASDPVYERGHRLPRALAEWACPTG